MTKRNHAGSAWQTEAHQSNWVYVRARMFRLNPCHINDSVDGSWCRFDVDRCEIELSQSMFFMILDLSHHLSRTCTMIVIVMVRESRKYLGWRFTKSCSHREGIHGPANGVVMGSNIGGTTGCSQGCGGGVSWTEKLDIQPRWSEFRRIALAGDGHNRVTTRLRRVFFLRMKRRISSGLYMIRRIIFFDKSDDTAWLVCQGTPRLCTSWANAQCTSLHPWILMRQCLTHNFWSPTLVHVLT
jgi:hypothetical protein